MYFVYLKLFLKQNVNFVFHVSNIALLLSRTMLRKSKLPVQRKFNQHKAVFHKKVKHSIHPNGSLLQHHFMHTVTSRICGRIVDKREIQGGNSCHSTDLISEIDDPIKVIACLKLLVAMCTETRIFRNASIISFLAAFSCFTALWYKIK